MSYSTVAYSLVLSEVQAISLAEKEELIRTALDEGDFTDEAEQAFQRQALQAIFGLGPPPAEVPYMLTHAFRSVCSFFARPIPTPIEMPAIRELCLDTTFGLNPPPFGFTHVDENVSCMTYQAMLRERPLLDECDREPLTFPDADWVLEYRKVFLSWFDYCLDRKTDLLSIEM